MKVYLIASTQVHFSEIARATEEVWKPQKGTTYAEDLTEFAGRLCYQSWDRPNPKTADNRAYVDHIIKNEDFSVMEHASVSLYVTGASRAFSHQMIRHRHFSYSQLSQRYVDEAWRSEPTAPRAITDRLSVRRNYEDAWNLLQVAYDEIVDELLADGLTRKQARDAARYILPNGQETRMLITGNHRSWREFFGKRRSDRASDEIHEFADEAYGVMTALAPNLYQDMEDAK